MKPVQRFALEEIDLMGPDLWTAPIEERVASGGAGNTDLVLLNPPPPPAPPRPPPAAPPLPPLTPFGGVVSHLSGVADLVAGGALGDALGGGTNASSGGAAATSTGEPAPLNVTREEVNAVLELGAEAP